MESIINAYKNMYIKPQEEVSAPLVEETLQEVLSDTEKDEVDYWNHEREPHVQDKIDSVFQGKRRLSIPLGNQIDTEPHPEVSEHVEKNGHHITDYLKGIAVNKENGKEIGIGKLLARTNAPSHVVSSYANDPARSSTKAASTDLHVVMSEHPHDVAGMTSRGHQWYNESCQNFNSGSYRHHLPDEVMNGTHVAYLCHNSDQKAEAPLARIALKRYDNEDEPEDFVIRPETRVYGKGGDLFHSTVSQWAQKHYPAQHGVTYNLADGSYGDTRVSYEENSLDDIRKAVESRSNVRAFVGDSYQGSNVAMKHALKINSEKNKQAEEEGPNTQLIKNEVIDNFVKHNATIKGDPRLHNTIARILHSNVESQTFHNSSEQAMLYATVHGKDYDTDNLTKAVNVYKDKGSSLPTNLISNRKLPDSVVDSLPVNQLSKVHESKIKPHHIDKVVDSYINNNSGSWYDIRDFSDRLTKDHFNKLIDNKPSADLSRLLANSPNVKGDQELWNKYFDSRSKTFDGTSQAINNEMPPSMVTKEHIDKFISGLPGGLNAEQSWRQFGGTVNRLHNTFHGERDPVSKEVGQYALDRLMDHYGQHKVNVYGTQKHAGLNLGNVPADRFKPEHIQKLHDDVPNTLEAPFEVHEKLHNKRLNKISDMTEHLLAGETAEEDEGTLTKRAADLSKEHLNFADEMENHLGNDHMEHETGYGEEDDHMNKAPNESHVNTLDSLNRDAEDFEDQAMIGSDHYRHNHGDGMHRSNRETISDKHQAIEDYENRYDHWY